MKPCKDVTPNLPVNVKIAESQDEYQTLCAHKVAGPCGATCFAVELDEQEIEQIKVSKRLYVSMLTFNRPMQPIFITGDSEVIEQVMEHYREQYKGAWEPCE
jgi:hypothetical protein